MTTSDKIHNYLFNIEKDPTDSTKRFPISKINKIVDHNGIGTRWLVFYTDLNGKDQSLLVREHEYNQVKPIGHAPTNPHYEHQKYLDKTRRGSVRASHYNAEPRSNRYPNGYMPKIEYYQAQLSIAVDSLDLDQIKYFTSKLEWFINRQAQKTS